MLAAAGVGSVVGSVPFAAIVHRARRGGDVREVGSGNPGAANVYRESGPAWGVLVLALDAGKGALAVVLSQWYLGEQVGGAAAIGAVLGHSLSPWLRFRGGRGVATALGAFGVLAPAATAASVAAFAIVVLATRWISLGSVLGAAVLPVACAWTSGLRIALPAAAAAAWIAWRHRPNFERMRGGTEPRFGSGGARGEEPRQ